MPKIKKIKKLPPKIKEVKEISHSKLEKEIEKVDSQKFVDTISPDLKLDPSIKPSDIPQDAPRRVAIAQDEQPAQPRRLYTPTVRAGDYNPSIRSDENAPRDYDPSIRINTIPRNSPSLSRPDPLRRPADEVSIFQDSESIRDFYEEKEKQEKQRRKPWEG